MLPLMRALVACCTLAVAHGFTKAIPRLRSALLRTTMLRLSASRDTDTSDDSSTTNSHRLNHRRKGHSDYFARREGIQIIVCEHVDDYRAAIQVHVMPHDITLEVGCAGGKTTNALGDHAQLAYGIDKSLSPGMLKEQQGYAQAHVKFCQMDANDVGALLQLSQTAAREAAQLENAQDSRAVSTSAPSPSPEGFSVILIDISGSAKLSAVLDLIERYEACFRGSLRLLIVKNFRLASLMDRARPFEAAVGAEGAAASTADANSV